MQRESIAPSNQFAQPAVTTGPPVLTGQYLEAIGTKVHPGALSSTYLTLIADSKNMAEHKSGHRVAA